MTIIMLKLLTLLYVFYNRKGLYNSSSATVRESVEAKGDMLKKVDDVSSGLNEVNQEV